ncbi:MAG: hypothetical protein WCP66_11855 [Methylococcales bacterium]
MRTYLITLFFALALVACGGGGGDSSSTTAPTLNANAAFSTLLTSGSTATGTLTGSCSGSSIVTNSPSYLSKNYDGISALIVEYKRVDSLSAASLTQAACAAIFSSNGQIQKAFYSPTTYLIMNEGGSTKGKVISGQQALPTSATAGTNGTLLSYLDYQGGATAVTSGTLTYAVAADSASTLLVTAIEDVTVASSGAPYYRVTTTYRLNANNTLTELSVKYETFAALGLGSGTVTTFTVN